MHLQDAADPLALALDRIENRVSGIQHAGVNAKERQVAHIGIGRDLERERGKRGIVIGPALPLFTVFENAANGRHFSR